MVCTLESVLSGNFQLWLWQFLRDIALCCDWVREGGLDPLPQKPFIGSTSPRFKPGVNTDIRYGPTTRSNLDPPVFSQPSKGDQFRRLKIRFGQIGNRPSAVEWLKWEGGESGGCRRLKYFSGKIFLYDQLKYFFWVFYFLVKLKYF